MEQRGKISVVFRLLILFVGLAAAVGSCVIVVDPQRLTEWQPQSEVRRTIDFQNDGNLVVKGDDGNLNILGWDKQQVEVKALARLRRPSRTNVSFYGMWQARPEIKLDKEQDRLIIRFELPGKPLVAMSALYEIRVPSSINLESIELRRGAITISDLYGEAVVRLNEGSVVIKNFSGSCEAAVIKGEIEVEILDLRAEDKIMLRTDDGNITIILEDAASAAVEVLAAEGAFESEFEFEPNKEGGIFPGRIGSGEAYIRLEAPQGRVKIIKSKEKHS